MQKTKVNSKITVQTKAIVETRFKMLVMMNDDCKKLSFTSRQDVTKNPLMASDTLVDLYLNYYEKKLNKPETISIHSKATTCVMLHSMMLAELKYRRGRNNEELRTLLDELTAQYTAKIVRASIEGEAA